MVKLLRWIPVLALAAAILAGCGEDGDTETAETAATPKAPVEKLKESRPLSVTLDGEPGPETAGLLTANSLNYFEEVGLKVSTYTPIGAERPVEYTLDGTVDVAVTHEPEAVLALESGKPIVALGSLVSGPTLSMMWLKESGVRDVADLKGKTVMIPGAPFQREFLEAVLAKAGLTLADVKLKQNAYQLTSALISGRADAVFGASPNVEGATIESRGGEPVITTAQELGLPPFDELVVIARKDRVSKEPKLFRVFMAAVKRGTAAAIADPEAAVNAISRADEDEFSLEPTEAGVEETLPLLSKTGSIDPKQARDLIAWMHEEGMIKRKLPASALTAP